MSFNRIAAIHGLIGVVLLALNIALQGDWPLNDDSSIEVADYISDNVNRHKAALLCGIMVTPFLLVFFGGLYVKLRTLDRRHAEAWGMVALSGAIIVVATATVGHAAFAALIWRGGEELDSGATRALWDLKGTAFASTGVGWGVLTASVSISSVIHNTWPRWHSGLGLIATILGLGMLLAVVSTDDAGNALAGVGFVGFLVWTLATSLMLFEDK